MFSYFTLRPTTVKRSSSQLSDDDYTCSRAFKYDILAISALHGRVAENDDFFKVCLPMWIGIPFGSKSYEKMLL